MIPYIIRRILHLIPTFIGATLLAFIIAQLVPSNYFEMMKFQPNVRPETIARMEKLYGIDKPLPIQYLKWMNNLVHGDLGMSFSSNQPVTQVLKNPIKNSMYIVVFSIFLLWIIAIPMGVFSAARQYSIADQIVSAISYFGLAIPNFFFAQIIILSIFLLRSFTRDAFDYNHLILPIAQMTSSNHDQMSAIGKAWDIFRHMLAPSFVLATAGVAGFTRILRSQMIEYLSSDFIRTARAKGLSRRTITYKHALRPAIIPFVAGIGGILPGLIGGAGLVEVVFAWPGITPTYLKALRQQDIYVVLGLLIVSTLLLMIGNIISDILLAAVDPRIRYS